MQVINKRYHIITANKQTNKQTNKNKTKHDNNDKISLKILNGNRKP